MSEHWYSRDGKACHTQNTKPGAKHPTRPTSIKDARLMSLLPSVSAIVREAYNPALERYKIGAAVNACYASPPMPGETVEAFRGRMAAEADKESGDARDLGTRIHKAIDDFYAGHPIPPELVDYVMAADDAVEHLGVEPMLRESVAVCVKHGYAGTTDMAFRGDTVGILDFKSCKTVVDEPVLVRQGYAAQLAAYHVAVFGDDTIPFGSVAYNVYISTTEIGRVDVVKYEPPALREEFAWFLSCAHLWRKRNNYDPRAHA